MKHMLKLIAFDSSLTPMSLHDKVTETDATVIMKAVDERDRGIAHRGR